MEAQITSRRKANPSIRGHQVKDPLGKKMDDCTFIMFPLDKGQATRSSPPHGGKTMVNCQIKLVKAEL